MVRGISGRTNVCGIFVHPVGHIFWLRTKRSGIPLRRRCA